MQHDTLQTHTHQTNQRRKEENVGHRDIYQPAISSVYAEWSRRGSYCGVHLPPALTRIDKSPQSPKKKKKNENNNKNQETRSYEQYTPGYARNVIANTCE